MNSDSDRDNLNITSVQETPSQKNKPRYSRIDVHRDLVRPPPALERQNAFYLKASSRKDLFKEWKLSKQTAFYDITEFEKNQKQKSVDDTDDSDNSEITDVSIYSTVHQNTSKLAKGRGKRTRKVTDQANLENPRVLRRSQRIAASNIKKKNVPETVAKIEKKRQSKHK